MKRSSGTALSFCAVVLAAGQGTRMRSKLTKVLHPICGRPLVSYPVAAALQAGARQVVVVVGHQAEAVEAALRASFPKPQDARRLRFVLQANPEGTGHAVLCARAAVEKSRAKQVMILNGDLPLIQASSLRPLLRGGAESLLSLLTIRLALPHGYGRILRERAGRNARFHAIVEEQDASPEQRKLNEVNVGAYLIDRRFLFEALGRVGRANKQGELYLTDLVALALQAATPKTASKRPKSSAKTAGPRAILCEDPLQLGELLGVNDRLELAAAEAKLRRRILEGHLRRGVSLQDPATTYVEATVQLARDVYLEAGVQLQGQTRLGEGVRVGTGSTLRSVEVGANTEIFPYSVLEESTIGARAKIGPFARVRPGSVLAAEVHLGNFVETKKTRLGRGAKANHLSYLGDAEIGAHSNIGAGTITCNYDGKHKHRTEIGADCFVGSNTALVAPVKVGAGAYIGAGSTITGEVPAGALGVARARQRNLAGWVKRRKAQAQARQSATVKSKLPVKSKLATRSKRANASRSHRRA